jgi:hypothetical protein
MTIGTGVALMVIELGKALLIHGDGQKSMFMM